MANSENYRLTPTARDHLRDARAWSLSRWGVELTEKYFSDLHEAAVSLEFDHGKRPSRKDLTGNTGLKIRAVREHYLVYAVTETQGIVIVAILRKIRDIQGILQKSLGIIQHDLEGMENEE